MAVIVAEHKEGHDNYPISHWICWDCGEPHQVLGAYQGVVYNCTKCGKPLEHL